jgi:hypothetical protein
VCSSFLRSCPPRLNLTEGHLHIELIDPNFIKIVEQCRGEFPRPFPSEAEDPVFAHNHRHLDALGGTVADVESQPVAVAEDEGIVKYFILEDVDAPE